MYAERTETQVVAGGEQPDLVRPTIGRAAMGGTPARFEQWSWNGRERRGCPGRERWHDLARESAQLLLAAEDGQQHVFGAGLPHCLEPAADLVRRSDQGVALGLAGCV